MVCEIGVVCVVKHGNCEVCAVLVSLFSLRGEIIASTLAFGRKTRVQPNEVLRQREEAGEGREQKQRGKERERERKSAEESDFEKGEIERVRVKLENYV